jgi:nucleotide-binding universal stress UspA family protein
MTEVHDTTVTIRNLSYSRALLLKMRLEMEGIPCFLTNIHHPDTGVDINLPVEYSEKAFLIIDEMREASGPEKEILVKTLKSVRRILVPVDFSPLSIKAAHYALELARTLKADIRLLNVWFNSANEGFVFNEMFAFQVNLEAIMKEQEAEAETKLLSVMDELRIRIRDEKIRGVDIDYDLVRGASVEAILEIVDDYKPGLVVMGTRGKNREGLGLLGSTTLKVIEKCKVPVLAVPSEYDISGFFAPRSVAYITNFDEADFHALHRLISFVRPFNVKIYCIHIQPNESYILDKVRMKKMREYFNETYADYNIECGLIETEDVLDGIETFILEKQIDLLALISRKRNVLTQLFRPSMTRKLLFQSEIPILVFRETENASWISRTSL